MKKWLITLMTTTLLLSIPLMALANGEDQATDQTAEDDVIQDLIKTASDQDDETDSDITSPDSFIYVLERFYEQLRLMLTFDSEEKFNLHMELASKRLAELKSLNEEIKAEYSSELYADFIENLEEAMTLAVKLKTKKEELNDLMAEMETVIEQGEEIVEEMKTEAELTIEVDEEEEIESELVKVTPAVVSHLDSEIITELRDEGYGYGQIAQIASIAALTDSSLDEVKEKMKEHKGIGKVAKEMGLHPGNLINRGKVAIQQQNKQTQDEDIQDTELKTEGELKATLDLDQHTSVELNTEKGLNTLLPSVKVETELKGKGHGQAKIKNHGQAEFPGKGHAKGHGKSRGNSDK
ncbi:MAG: hypothetical protein H0Z33_03260 [Bacillaceae bacterium]|nr:hypothetical protein [Bacillaceae bacterium]